MVSHRNLVANGMQVMLADDAAKARNWNAENTQEVHCAYVPLYHASESMLSPFLRSHLETYFIPVLTFYSGIGNLLHRKHQEALHHSRHVGIHLTGIARRYPPLPSYISSSRTTSCSSAH